MCAVCGFRPAALGPSASLSHGPRTRRDTSLIATRCSQTGLLSPISPTLTENLREISQLSAEQNQREISRLSAELGPFSALASTCSETSARRTRRTVLGIDAIICAGDAPNKRHQRVSRLLWNNDQISHFINPTCPNTELRRDLITEV